MTQTARLTVFNGKAHDYLGEVVASSPTRVAVESGGAGSVYLFHTPANGWKTTGKPNGRAPSGGYSLAIEDHPPTVVVGVRENGAYLFGKQ